MCMCICFVNTSLTERLGFRGFRAGECFKGELQRAEDGDRRQWSQGVIREAGSLVDYFSTLSLSLKASQIKMNYFRVVRMLNEDMLIINTTFD